MEATTTQEWELADGTPYNGPVITERNGIGWLDSYGNDVYPVEGPRPMTATPTERRIAAREDEYFAYLAANGGEG